MKFFFIISKLTYFQQNSALYVAKDLDLSEWAPTHEDFNQLCNWLTNYKLDSNYSLLSRIIFNKMAWGNSDLLPWKLHCNLAMCIVEASANYAPDQIAGNFLQDSVRHVSNLAGKLRKTPEQVFTSWAWEMASRLCLHRFDRKSNMADIIDLDLDEEHLGEAVATKNPLASYVALQTSQTGHLVEDVLERGLSQLNLVFSSGHYDHVLECMANVTPLFLDDPSLLTNSADFIKIVQQIVCSDQTFLKMAKDLVISDFPGPVLKEFVNMMAYQVKNFETYKRSTPLPISMMWISILCEIPNWNSNRNVLYALDYCCKAARSVENGIGTLKASIKGIDQKLLDSNKEGFLSWISGSKAGNSSFYTAQMSEFSWLSFYILEAEEERESSTQVWRELVRELCENGELISLDKCLKKVVSDGNYSEYVHSVNNLPIYRWCQLILDCPLEQPMQVVFAQKFFKYFTARANENSARLGRFFFEGVINTHYFGRVLAKFKTIRDYHKKSSVEIENYSGLAEAFQAFVLWLEDMFILDEKLHLASISPRMMPDLLGKVLNPSLVRIFFSESEGCLVFHVFFSLLECGF